MSIVNQTLYDKIKKQADKIYNKPSAYKSAYIVRRYKESGGKYSGKFPTNKGLDTWFKEDWKDVGNSSYPVYRPTKRVSAATPLILKEIDPTNLQQQIKLKQKIKGKKNLPPFKSKFA